MKVKCPYCNTVQDQEPLKEWAYGKLIAKRTLKGTKMGASIKCSRYQCKCKEFFIFYKTTKGKTWTNPKPKEQ